MAKPIQLNSKDKHLVLQKLNWVIENEWGAMKKPIWDQIYEKKKVPPVGLEPTKALKEQRVGLAV